MPTPFSRSSSRSSRSLSSASDESNQLVSSRCPECGAPIDFRSAPSDQSQIKCSYCGTLINIPGRSHQRDASEENEVEGSTIVVSTKSGSGCGAVAWIVVTIIIMAIGISIWSATSINSMTRMFTNAIESDIPRETPNYEFFDIPKVQEVLAPPPRLSNAPVILGGSDSAAAQMVIAAYQEEGSILLAFDPEQREEAWRSPLLSDKYYDAGISADAARVYVADGAKLMALDRNNGEIVWQSSLANDIQSSCPPENPCLQQVSDQTVALSRDGTIQGFAGSSGAPLWSRRLNSQPRQFIVSNDQVIVVDNDDSNRAVVYVINGVNGDLIHQIEPRCTFPNIEWRPHSSDQFIVTPDGSALLIVGSGSYACVWRYSLADGSLTWHYIPEDINGPLPFTWSTDTLAVADPTIYFTNDLNNTNVIYELDTQTEGATPQILYTIDDDYELALHDTVGDLLLVTAQPDYARDEVELWAIDRNSGERRWQRKLDTTHTFDKWEAHPTAQGIFLMVCSWDDDVCHFQTLDLATGASKGEVSEVTGSPYSGAGWLGDQGFLTIDGKLYAFNLNSAEVKYSWP